MPPTTSVSPRVRAASVAAQHGEGVVRGDYEAVGDGSLRLLDHGPALQRGVELLDDDLLAGRWSTIPVEAASASAGPSAIVSSLKGTTSAQRVTVRLAIRFVKPLKARNV
jgi:hypothetical protein